MDTIVVGVGEGGASSAAVQWAGAEADRRGWQVELLRALQHPSAAAAGVGAWYPDDLEGELDALALADLEDAQEAVSSVHPSLAVATTLVHTHPRLALAKASETAAMVVTGSRNRSRLVGALLGSTSLHAAAHAHCPVAVVHAPPALHAHGVVVGWDGSAAADEAVAFAAEEAAALGEELLVVLAWFLAAVFPGGFDPQRYVARSQRQEADQRSRLDHVVAGVRTRWPALAVRSTLLVDQFASDGLLHAAATARLLVVGSRGHGAFASMLLGSTSRNVLQNALTPVVVVPDRVRVAGSTPVEPAAVDAAASGPPVGVPS